MKRILLVLLLIVSMEVYMPQQNESSSSTPKQQVQGPPKPSWWGRGRGTGANRDTDNTGVNTGLTYGPPKPVLLGPPAPNSGVNAGHGQYGPPVPAGYQAPANGQWWQQGASGNAGSTIALANAPALGPTSGATQWWKNPKKKDLPLGPLSPADYNAGPAPAPVLSGSFLSANGETAMGPNGEPVQTNTPVGSFLSGGGDYGLGYNGLPYYIGGGSPGPNTFIAAGGEAMRGPSLSFAGPDAGAGGGGGGGFGSNYDWWRKKRGYGGGGGGGGYGGYERSDYTPNWQLGLQSWNYGE